MHSTLVIFLDGVGIGRKDKVHNPFFTTPFDFFTKNFYQTPHLNNQNLERNGKYVFPINACMGIEGLPQSGTGQTSIYCGINASKLIERHFGPYAHSRLKPILEESNIFSSLKSKGKKVFFANAFPQVFFDYINSGKTRLNVTSVMMQYAKMRFNNVDDLIKGRALTAEITNQRWVDRLDYKIPIIEPEIAAERLIKISSENHFTLFEYFHTDHLGHGRVATEKEQLLCDLDRFLNYILQNIGQDISLLICSDHGNIEDLSTRGHTSNPALGMSAGKNAEQLRNRIKFLYDIKPAIMEFYR